MKTNVLKHKYNIVVLPYILQACVFGVSELVFQVFAIQLSVFRESILKTVCSLLQTFVSMLCRLNIEHQASFLIPTRI